MISGISKIEEAFSKAEEEEKHVLVGFLTCGDPSPKHTPKLVRALIEGGVDIVELGLPFSDPIADGPIIQAADVRALDSGSTPRSTFEIARAMDRNIPIVLLTYFNPILKMGVDNFLSEARDSGINGTVVPDLLTGSRDGVDFARRASEQGIASITMAAPSTEKERLENLVKSTRGFLYLVSLLGVTGSRKSKSSIGADGLDFIRCASKIAKRNSKRAAVGFGISRPEHVKEVINAGADGVIVGSSFVNIVAENKGNMNRACQLLKKHASTLKRAT